ncbi:MAG: PKD domain-containing protein [bacterium]
MSLSALLPLLVASLQVPLADARDPRHPCPGLVEERSTLTSNTFPPCIDVTLTADATGAPPLSYEWTLPDGQLLAGNPATLDTGLLPDGFHEIELAVTNDFGTATHTLQLTIEQLAFAEPPSFAVDGTTVTATANTVGATEWRWSWGDGTATSWLSGCDGYQPTHTYADLDTYQVTVEARSCREGPLRATGTLDLTGSAPVIETFQVLCPTSPFCSFEAGEPVSFEILVQGTPDAYIYDWNGDGFDDETTAQPVESHVYTQPGFFIPRLTVLADDQIDQMHHETAIEIRSAPSLLFDYDFEEGTLDGWTPP